jgi:hypothetical protein
LDIAAGMRLPILLALLLGLAARPAAAQAPDPFSFVAFGDMPYCSPVAPQDCPAEEGRVARLMLDINRARPAFSIFVGDALGGSEICSDDKLLRGLNWMTIADHPLVYTPGDNEWTDCWRDGSGRYDPLERLAFLRARYFRDALSLGRRPMPLIRQADIDPAHRLYVENARWARNGVVFATIHMPGSNNNRPTEPDERPVIRPPAGAMEEFQARDAANTAWLEATFAEATRTEARAVVLALQADIFWTQRCGPGWESGQRAFRDALGRQAAAFGKPVLLIVGDAHVFLHDRPMAAAPNLTRIMVPGDRETRAVRIEVDPSAADPWGVSLIGPDDRLQTRGC